MNFWKNPENNSLKVGLLVVVLVILGFFVYKSLHSTVSNEGQVIGTVTPSSTTAGSKTAGGNPPGDYPCDKSTPLVALGVSLGAPTTPLIVSTGTGMPHPGHWLNFNLTNPGDCPVTVSKAQIALTTNDREAWPPVQNVMLMHGGTQLGVTLKVAGAVQYVSGTFTTGSHTITVNSTDTLTVGNPVQITGASPAIGTITSIPSTTTFVMNITTAGTGISAGSSSVTDYGSALMTFNFPGTGAVTIAPHSSELFNLIADAQNTPGGGHFVFRFQLREFLGTNPFFVANDQTLGGTGIHALPATIVSSTVPITY